MTTFYALTNNIASTINEHRTDLLFAGLGAAAGAQLADRVAASFPQHEGTVRGIGALLGAAGMLWALKKQRDNATVYGANAPTSVNALFTALGEGLWDVPYGIAKGVSVGLTMDAMGATRPAYLSTPACAAYGAGIQAAQSFVSSLNAMEHAESLNISQEMPIKDTRSFNS